MTQKNIGRDAENHYEELFQQEMRLPIQYNLNFGETPLQIHQRGFIEVCPSCGTLSTKWESPAEDQTNSSDQRQLSYQSNVLQMSLEWGI